MPMNCKHQANYHLVAHLSRSTPQEAISTWDIAFPRCLQPHTLKPSGNPLGHALIVAMDAENVGIEGEGTVDGQSPALKKNQKTYAVRPFLLRWVRCTNVTVRNLRLTNPGAWTLNLFQTNGAVIDGVTIRSRDLGMHNNDGIDLDSCENVRIRHCDITSGDDALCIKATLASKPSRNIVATDCQLSSRCNAIKLGTEAIGGFENITISHCQISNTKMAGIALYAVDGGDLRHISISDVTMDGVVVPISIRLGARLKTFREGDSPKPNPGKLRDVVIKNVQTTLLKPDARPATVFIDVADVTPAGFAAESEVPQ